MRILWQSNRPGSPQGYGVQSRYLLPRLKALGHELAVFAFYGLEGGKATIDGWPTYPRFADPFGNDAVAGHMRDWRADVLVTLMDTWALDPRVYGQFPWLAWMPIDHDPIPDAVRARLQAIYKPLALSRFGEGLIRKAGRADVTYIPHGVDTRLFKPFAPEARAEAKRQLGFSEDEFVVGMVGANKGFPARKGFPEALLGFKAFQQEQPSARLYIHAHIADDQAGVHLGQLVDELGLRHLVRFPDQYEHALGLPAEYLAIAYNGMDVLLQPSYSEGFGIPVIEAQACGTPVIANDCTALSELVAESGYLIEPAQRFWSTQGAWQWLPSVERITEALGAAHDIYSRPSEFEDLRLDARIKALDYDWDEVVSHYWKPLLDQVAQERGLPTSGDLQARRQFVQVDPSPLLEDKGNAVLMPASDLQEEMAKAAHVTGCVCSLHGPADLGHIDATIDGFARDPAPVRFVAPLDAGWSRIDQARARLNAQTPEENP